MTKVKAMLKKHRRLVRLMLPTLALAAILAAGFPKDTFASSLSSSVNSGSNSVMSFIKTIFPGIAAVSFGIIGLAFFGPRKLKEWAKDHIWSTIAGIAFILLAVAGVSFFVSTFGG